MKMRYAPLMIVHLICAAGGVMAGSIATIVALWISLQSMGFLGQTNTIGAHKLPVTVQNYLSTVGEFELI